MPLALVAATVIAVIFIGAAQGPINPASAHVLAQRVPREWFGMVFSLKQTGVPIGFALAGLIFPVPAGAWSAGAAPAWSPPALPSLAAIVVELLRPSLDVVVDRRQAVDRHLALRPLRVGPRAAARARAGRPSSMSSPSTPSPSIS